jgi:ABC-type protease/lipase transport system fused ATPase/permease subunit
MSKFEQNYGFPLINLIYIIGSSIVLGVFGVGLWVFFSGTYVIHPVLCMMCIIGAIGLLGTAILSIKDWRKWRKDQNNE